MEIVSITETPNPSTMKINLSEGREGMQSDTYTSIDESQPQFINDILAIDGVRSIFHAMDFISVDLMDESMESELSMEGPDMSSPAQAYAKRLQHKTLRRRDGTDNFRTITGSSGQSKREGDLRAQREADEQQEDQQEVQPLAERDTPRSKYLTGLGGFGDNEAQGKILPCHRVREDGLMRITYDTVSADLYEGLKLGANEAPGFNHRSISFSMANLTMKLQSSGSLIVGLNTSTREAISTGRLTSIPPRDSRTCSLDRMLRSLSPRLVAMARRRRSLCSIASLVAREHLPCEFCPSACG